MKLSKLMMILPLAFALRLNASDSIKIAEKWNEYANSIRDGKITKDEARLKINPLMEELSSCMKDHDFDSGEWAFPLKGYSKRAMDKRDYKPNIHYGPYDKKGYDYFDGGKSGGHPAYDIFIRDNNFDSIDDKTKKPVDVVAVTDFIVVSANKEWDFNKNGIFEKGDIRGGKYISAYNPKINKYFIYSHLNDVHVNIGDFVKKGQTIGILGRTGSSAVPANKRYDKQPCPTHLHFAVLEYKDSTMKPFNYYGKLK